MSKNDQFLEIQSEECTGTAALHNELMPDLRRVLHMVHIDDDRSTTNQVL